MIQWDVIVYYMVRQDYLLSRKDKTITSQQGVDIQYPSTGSMYVQNDKMTNALIPNLHVYTYITLKCNYLHNDNKMPRECKLEDQRTVIAVFPLAPDDDDGQLCVHVRRKSS